MLKINLSRKDDKGITALLVGGYDLTLFAQPFDGNDETFVALLKTMLREDVKVSLGEAKVRFAIK